MKVCGLRQKSNRENGGANTFYLFRRLQYKNFSDHPEITGVWQTMTVRKGDLFLLPRLWICEVTTIVDSVVFGYNFIQMDTESLVISARAYVLERAANEPYGKCYPDFEQLALLCMHFLNVADQFKAPLPYILHLLEMFTETNKLPIVVSEIMKHVSLYDF